MAAGNIKHNYWIYHGRELAKGIQTFITQKIEQIISVLDQVYAQWKTEKNNLSVCASLIVHESHLGCVYSRTC
jgi:hypothetical protein